ncbi:hypothetical protein CEXT_268871 [Caerostris extrusa]|uniref:Uncharacterized protein n=1 Tax=Caerostris extrusa TaxID=172846 RepID=A0AAV4TE65_CAEEX|nr:hypothetical protein CEXT_268871 [Caerostris extrusa]
MSSNGTKLTFSQKMEVGEELQQPRKKKVLLFFFLLCCFCQSLHCKGLRAFCLDVREIPWGHPGSFISHHRAHRKKGDWNRVKYWRRATQSHLPLRIIVIPVLLASIRVLEINIRWVRVSPNEY